MTSMKKFAIIWMIGIILVSSQTLSLTNLLASRVRQAPQKPTDCLRWDGNGCQLCSKGFWPDENGKCIQQTSVDADVDSEDLGEAVSDNYEPCEGQTHCQGSKNFINQNDFDKFIKQYTGEPIVQQYVVDEIAQPQALPLIRREESFAADASFSQAKSASAPQPSSDRDFSGTNNQQENVDEADILKTDGTYIYTISNGILSIIQAYPLKSIKLISKVEIEGFNPTALFIEGNYLTIFGTKYNYQAYGGAYKRPYYGGSSTTVVKIYNIYNRANPYVVKNYQIEGSYFNGRKTQDGYVYLLTTHRVFQRANPIPWYNLDGKEVNFPFRSVFYYPEKYRYPLFVSIFSFNLRNPLRNQRGLACLITQNAYNIYMSERAIYVSYTDYNNGQDSTVIHKIYIRRTKIIPFANGQVRGSVNNQFSFDEYKHVLRVATTSNEQIGNIRTTSNNVFCLSYFLKQIGQLTKIAPGERIFSARYVDRRLYLVTFRQVDPFFVISLANHRSPKILGELKITGFSRYLHPYSEDVIVGLGRQADANGRQQGLKISLFDVSDVRNPKEISKFELEQKYASSTSEWEHKAFLLSRSKNLLVIPGSMNYNQVKFNGVFVFYIDSTSIKLRSIVDHLLSDKDNFYQRGVERSLYIEEFLYTKSQCLLRVNRIYDLNGITNVEIPCQKKPQPQIYYRSEPVPVPLPFVINNAIRN